MTEYIKVDQEWNHFLKLATDGSNWVNYKVEFELAVGARSLLDHLKGTKLKPTHPSTKKG
jgi:hypothetical protein